MVPVIFQLSSRLQGYILGGGYVYTKPIIIAAW